MDKDEGEKTFVRVTNQHIYDKLCSIEKKVDKTNGSVKLHRRWLTALTGVFGTVFLFIISKIW